VTVARLPGRIAVLCGRWGRPDDETSVAVRAIAGAASRVVDVDVLVPGPIGAVVADGAFDVLGVGEPVAGRRWPHAVEPVEPLRGRAAYGAVLVEDADEEAVSAVGRLRPEPRIVRLEAGDGARRRATSTAGGPGPDTVLAVSMGGAPAGVDRVGLHLPVNPLAAQQPHLELGPARDYVLVLTDRGADVVAAQPAPRIAWLVARFPRRSFVSVENAIATVWRSRSPVARFGVHSRMDLWRLVAHARATVDLRPGPLFARECVESLRYGVPVIVPAGTSAARLAVAGGLVFEDLPGLFDAVDAIADDAERSALAGRGRVVAEEWYGDPGRFVQRVGAALERSMPA
jgi:hypothetical protein